MFESQVIRNSSNSEFGYRYIETKLAGRSFVSHRCTSFPFALLLLLDSLPPSFSS